MSEDIPKDGDYLSAIEAVDIIESMLSGVLNEKSEYDYDVLCEVFIMNLKVLLRVTIE